MSSDESREIQNHTAAVRTLHTPGTNLAPRSEPAALESALDRLNQDGFVVIEGAIDPAETQSIRDEVAGMLDAFGRNPFEGFRTQRVYGVMARTVCCDPIVEHPLVLDLLDRLLLPNYLLSQLVAIDIQPGEDAQTLHHDDGLYPIPRPRNPLSAAAIWALEDFDEANGGTRVIPGSHLWDDRVPTAEDLKDVISVEMPAGSMVFFLGTLWHGGGANRSERGRLCLTSQYCEPWCRTVENYSLSMPIERVAPCSETLQRMLGFSIHPPLMGYVDGRHPKRLLDT